MPIAAPPVPLHLRTIDPATSRPYSDEILTTRPFTWQHEDVLGTDPTFPHDVHDPAWGNPPWPQKFKGFYPHQVNAALEILDHFNAGANVVMLNAPTGSGKTLLGEMTRRLLDIQGCLYVTNTKSLQDQMMRDFGEYARTLKGRTNYATFDHPELFDATFRGLNAGDCTKSRQTLPACDACPQDKVSDRPVLHCSNCHGWWQCPYERAKAEALSADLAVTNTSYFISEANGPGNFSSRPLVIMDEAETSEAILLNHIELHLPSSKCQELGLDPPDRKTVEASWIRWVEDEAGPKVKRLWEAAKANVDSNPTVTATRKLNYLTRLLSKLEVLSRELAQGNVVYDGYQDGDIRFKPIRVNLSAPANLWDHGEKWLLMSATIIDPQQLADDLGMDNAGVERVDGTREGLRWELVNVPSTFPPANRPIYIKPIASMTWKEKETSWPAMVDGVKRVLAKHPDERVLVHTVSYALTQFIREGLRDTGRPIFTYGKASEREMVLAKYKRVKGAVLLAPSMDRGVDLAGDDCRVVVVVKMPVPNTKDKRVEKRLYAKGGQMWLLTQTLANLVQMSGRATRNPEDFSSVYVLDKVFVTKTWPEGRRFLPSWWVEAIRWDGGGI